MSDTAIKVLVFSDDVDKRRAVIEGVGTRPTQSLPEIEWFETATAQAVVDAVAAAAKDDEDPGFAALILDGETQKEGGMAVARRLDGLHDDLPPVVMLVARQQDDWLATWSGAAVTVPLPIDPIEIQDTVLGVLSGKK